MLGGSDQRQAEDGAVLDRRAMLVGAGASAALLAWLSGASGTAAQEKIPTWEEVVSRIVGEAKPVDGKLLIEMPEIAENGNTVPFTIAVESPMTETDYVKAIHIVSTGNPVANVATFRLTPLAGKASLSSRIRLAKTQDVILLAELSNGTFLMSRHTVKVTIGGCGG